MSLEQILDGKIETVILSLRVAAEQYDKDANALEGTHYGKVVMQFRRQAKEARELALALQLVE